MPAADWSWILQGLRAQPDRSASATRAALQISWISIWWSVLSGSASVAIGLSVASLALVGSGASILIDLSSSAVLVWRFRHPQGHLGAERRAHLVAALALCAL